MARQPLTPHPLYGWNPDLNVETERAEKTPYGVRYRVYVMGAFAGYVESMGRDWDYFTQAMLDAYRAENEMKAHADSPRLAYGSKSRHDAVLALVEKVTR